MPVGPDFGTSNPIFGPAVPLPDPPREGEGVDWAFGSKLIHFIPVPKTSRILPSSPRTGGLQANSGEVSRVGALPLPQVPGRPHRGERPRDGNVTGQFQKPAPRDGNRLTILQSQGRQPSRGPSIHDNRSTGGASARPDKTAPADAEAFE